ncbi:MAG TPA: amidophosphoribosyltransferase [Planctomycetaceae bacterium]|nr:amidophosphoribosyltransferase [Planctomycetaceae bacterium]
MSDLHHECGLAAVYHLPNQAPSRLLAGHPASAASRLIPGMLVDMQNRGQLAAGLAAYHPHRDKLLVKWKGVGAVSEVFRLNHRAKFESILHKCAGPAAIGHVRYATCGKEGRNYAQPFERRHIEKLKWFSFAYNGQLANYPQLRHEILANPKLHLALETDTEILLHLIAQELSDDKRPSLHQLLTRLARRLDGAYNLIYLNACGDMFVARDPLGMRPLCYAREGALFAAASESVALIHLGFSDSSIKNVPPGHAVIIENGEFSIQKFAESPRTAHCFFEWIYFANVASTFDDRSVYLTRKRLGEELAQLETVAIDADTIVVPVPDTAKAAADAMAYRLNVPSQEGLIRNRYVGRTFIEGQNRADKVRMKYTALPEVLEGKKVLLVEDTIVRSTTMRALISQIKERGRAREVHVRIACPPIIAPCFYGIDMSTVSELFAPRFMEGSLLTPEIEMEMAKAIGADSLHYLPLASIARCLDQPASRLCQACIDGRYPTSAGERLYQIALNNAHTDHGPNAGRTYDSPARVSTAGSAAEMTNV